jgi:hypothetical protein
MSSLQQRIATVADTTANLIAQLRELDRLRDQVRDARLSARSGMGTSVSQGLIGNRPTVSLPFPDRLPQPIQRRR